VNDKTMLIDINARCPGSVTTFHH